MADKLLDFICVWKEKKKNDNQFYSIMVCGALQKHRTTDKLMDASANCLNFCNYFNAHLPQPKFLDISL
jgi:hypothetical protein